MKKPVYRDQLEALQAQLNIKMKKSQAQAFREFLDYSTIEESRQLSLEETKAYRYLISFKQKSDNIYIAREPKINVSQMDVVNFQRRSAFLSRFETTKSHTPIFENIRYIGVEIECLVSHDGSECCDNCGGSGDEAISCPDCDGSGNVDVDCDNCGGSGEYTNLEGESISCSDCDGSGVESHECSRCDGSGAIYENCSECDGRGYVDNEDIHIEEVQDTLEKLGIPFIEVKQDGSLENECDYRGLEIAILVPETNLNLIEKVCKTLRKKHNAIVNDSCGLHVHLDTRHLSREEFERAAHRLNRANLVLRNMTMPYRRGEDAYNKAGLSFGERYYEVNASRGSRSTIEMRNYHATVDGKEIIQWAKLLIKAINCDALDGLETSYSFAAERMIATFEALGLDARERKYVLGKIKENNKEYTSRILKGFNQLDLKKNAKIHSIQTRLAA